MISPKEEKESRRTKEKKEKRHTERQNREEENKETNIQKNKYTLNNRYQNQFQSRREST